MLFTSLATKCPSVRHYIFVLVQSGLKTFNPPVLKVFITSDMHRIKVALLLLTGGGEVLEFFLFKRHYLSFEIKHRLKH